MGQIKLKTKTDPIYNNELVAKLVNKVMKSGKKSVAQKQVYQAFSQIQTKKEDALIVFQRAINNIAPKVEVRSKRVGGAAYQVPTEVRGNRKTSLAIRWLIQAAQSRSTKDYHSFAQKLAAEIIDASNNEGEAVKKRDTTHRMAEANRVFSHFRW